MKKITFFVSALLLSACSSNGVVEEYAGEKGDQLLIQTGNYSALVNRYQKQVKESPSPELRFKLANALYLSGDPEAAQFQLALIPQDDLKNAELDMLRANVAFDLNKNNVAEQFINAALRRNDRYAEAYNLKGLLLAQRGSLQEAKKSFEAARQYGFDDAIVKNNLAMVAMLQGNFELAADILLPLVRNGRADSTVEANLLLALAKSGRTREFSQLISTQGSNAAMREKYISLNQAKAINQFSQSKITQRPATLPTALPSLEKEKDLAEPSAIIAARTLSPKREIMPKEKPKDVIPAPKTPAPVVEKPTASADEMKLLLAKKRLKAALEAKRRGEEIKPVPVAKTASTHKKKVKKSRSRYLVTDMNYVVQGTDAQYTVTSDFELGSIRTEYLEKRKKWVFDIKGAKDFTIKRRRYLTDGPVKKIVLGEHPGFVRVVLEMRENTPQKPELLVENNTLTIRWKS